MLAILCAIITVVLVIVLPMTTLKLKQEQRRWWSFADSAVLWAGFFAYIFIGKSWALYLCLPLGLLLYGAKIWVDRRQAAANGDSQQK